MGYSFGDEHINNLIYQALTIPTFRLVIFTDLVYYNDEGIVHTRENINRLKELNDPRIWIVGSNKEFNITPSVEVNDTGTKEGTPSEDNPFEKEKNQKLIREELNPSSGLNYFSTIVKDFLPDWSENKIEDQNEKLIELMNANSRNMPYND
jgi:hypothetical protein